MTGAQVEQKHMGAIFFIELKIFCLFSDYEKKKNENRNFLLHHFI